MTPDELKTAGTKLFGRKHWKLELAQALDIDVATVHRMCHKERIPGHYEVAIVGLLNTHRARLEIEKQAKQLVRLTRRVRKKK